VAAAAKETKIEAVLPNDASQWRLLLKAMRPYQWCKNLLVFVPIVTAQQIGNVNAWLTAATMFFAFCLAASGTYLINDLRDLAADRKHSRKRRRPFASGLLPLHVGMIAAPLLMVAALGASFLCGAPQILVIYLCLSLAYAFWLKARPLTDTFVLAALYTLRLFGGGAATGFRVSLWLLAFSSFQFLSLAVVKRVSELSEKYASGKSTDGTADVQIVGRGYFLSDTDVLQQIGVAAGFAASLVLALYVQAELSPGLDRRPTLAWAIVPLTLFWECRIWLATARGHMHDDPILYAFRDRVSWLVGLCAVAALLFGNHVSL
jgi:4-hydroxybenzoate polyprenyltransferase